MDLRKHPLLGPTIEAQAGVVSLAQLPGELSYGQVRAQISARRWQRAGRGVLLTTNAEPTPDQRLWIALLQAPRGSALSGPTAAALDGMRVSNLGLPGSNVGQRGSNVGLHASDLEPVHITIPCGERRPIGCDADVHWSRFLDTADVHPTRAPRRTRLPRSVVDWAAWQELKAERAVRAVVLSAVQQRVTTPAQLRTHLARRGHCRHLALIDESIDDAEGGIASIPEREFTGVVRRVGLPKPSRQVMRWRPSGRAYLDVDWERYRYSAEIEGAQHFEAAHREHDLERLNDLVIGGDRVLLFSSFAIRRRPDYVASVLVRALRSGGWTGSAAA